MLAFKRRQHSSSPTLCSLQCSEKSCLRTPSLKKRVSEANLEGKKDSGMLKYIRLQVLTDSWIRNVHGAVIQRGCQIAHLQCSRHPVPLHTVSMKILLIGGEECHQGCKPKNPLLVSQPASTETRLEPCLLPLSQFHGANPHQHMVVMLPTLRM